MNNIHREQYLSCHLRHIKTDEELDKMSDRSLYQHFKWIRKYTSLLANSRVRLWDSRYENEESWEKNYIVPYLEYFDKLKIKMSARNYNAKADLRLTDSKRKRRKIAKLNKSKSKSKDR